MLKEKELEEIKEHLNKAQNPLFLFDDDQDGLCSFLILQRAYDKGKGFPIKSPRLNEDYFRKVKELDIDYIFVLDKPEISEDFFEKVKQENIPLVWIDHHDIDRSNIPEFVNYYNPLFSEGENVPVTYICYKIAQKDLWLGVLGCISDRYFPEFYYEFREKYPDLAIESEDPSRIFYCSDIGKLGMIFGFGLKDKTTNVVNMMKFLKNVKNPYEVLDDTNKSSFIKRFDKLRKKYDRLVEEAKRQATESKILFFRYGGDTSMSSEIANRLSFLFPEKYIIVVYDSNGKVNISARGENVKGLVLKALEDFEDASGGGHENAVGARIRREEIEKFMERLESLI